MRQTRFEQLSRASAELTNDGYLTTCLIAQTHPLDQAIKAQPDGRVISDDEWATLERRHIDMCDRMVVIKLPNWERSVGTKREIDYCKSIGKPIDYIEPTEYVMGTSQTMRRDVLPKGLERG